MNVFIEGEYKRNLLDNAKFFSDYREKCKRFLAQHGAGYDKFTVTENDSLSGYISEEIVRDYIDKKLNVKSVVTWHQNFDFDIIDSILNKNNSNLSEINQDEIRYIKEYFYDKYDLKLTTKNDTEIMLDVKTAVTPREPKDNWSFLLPVIQIDKAIYQYTILTYCITKPNSYNLEDLEKFNIFGMISTDFVRTCNQLLKGTLTGHGTKNQIDNYETKLYNYEKKISNLQDL